MEVLPQEIRDNIAVLRRIIFASVHLPKELPGYWSIISKFASQETDKEKTIQPESVRIAIDNIKLLNDKAFATDEQLIREIHAFSSGTADVLPPLGIVLISQNSVCKLCNNKLLVKADRPSHVTVYTESYGTVIGTHYHKYCQAFKRGCSFRQYYGYSSSTPKVTSYDSNWQDHKFFFSSRETVFELNMLDRFDAELLLGQISYI